MISVFLTILLLILTAGGGEWGGWIWLTDHKTHIYIYRNPITNCIFVNAVQVDWVTMNFVPFSEKVLWMIVDLYCGASNHQAVIGAHVLQNIIRVSERLNSKKVSTRSLDSIAALLKTQELSCFLIYMYVLSVNAIIVN